ncbi:MAG: hypothetical protein EPN92_12275 [Chitinophagaceae bacterium]|nr:MAG: hypothetical protein EPN92_12275 [Chitinophagaceae bacterium]
MKKNYSTLQYGLYIDHRRAYIICVDEKNEMSGEELKSGINTHPRISGETTNKTGLFRHTLNKESQQQNKTNNEFKKFCKQVAGHLKKVNQVFIFGPSDAKHEMQNELESRKSLAGIYTAVETTNKMTLDEAKRFVKSHFVK